LGRYRCGQRPGGLKAFAAAKTGRLFKAAWLPTGDAIVAVGIDRLGRNAAEVMTTIRELGERRLVLRSLREIIDTSNATGSMVAGVLDRTRGLSYPSCVETCQQTVQTPRQPMAPALSQCCHN